MEVLPEETPWPAVPEPPPWYQRSLLLLPPIVPRLIFNLVELVLPTSSSASIAATATIWYS